MVLATIITLRQFLEWFMMPKLSWSSASQQLLRVGGRGERKGATNKAYMFDGMQAVDLGEMGE